MNKSKFGKVAFIAIDAAEYTLIQRGIDEGSLPNLKRLREQGSWGEIDSTADWLAGTPWPTLYTGTYPPEHGYSFFLQWRPDLMKHQRPDDTWLELETFYRKFPADGPRTIAIDTPLCFAARPFNGVEVVSWSTHDKMMPFHTYPPELKDRIAARFGRPPVGDEVYGPQRPNELLKQRDELIESAAKQTDLAIALTDEHPFDFFIMAYGGVHRAGHKLWDHTSARGRITEQEKRELDGALQEVTVATDREVGRLVDHLLRKDPDTAILVGSLHGMTANYSLYHLFDEMLDRVVKNDRREPKAAGAPRGPLHKLREAVPLEWRSKVKSMLPVAVQDKLSMFWRQTDERDWSQTRAISVVGDLQGLVQINLKGREREGIVEPGEEYNQLVDQICEGLMTWVNPDTGEPVFHRVARGDTLYPEARSRQNMPDVLADWRIQSSVNIKAIRSERYGTIINSCAGSHADGRSGHHVPVGWLVANAPHIQPGIMITRTHELNLTATIFALLGLDYPEHMHGKPIAELCPPGRCPVEPVRNP